MSEQPTALLLAEKLEQQFPLGTAQHYLDGEAAAELRRLHSVNAQLLEALETIYAGYDKEGVWMIARAAIAAAHGIGEKK